MGTLTTRSSPRSCAASDAGAAHTIDGRVFRRLAEKDLVSSVGKIRPFDLGPFSVGTERGRGGSNSARAEADRTAAVWLLWARVCVWALSGCGPLRVGSRACAQVHAGRALTDWTLATKVHKTGRVRARAPLARLSGALLR